MDKGPEKTFLQQRYTNGQWHLKRYSTSLNTREIQIKTTWAMTFHPLGWLKSKREIITSVDKDNGEIGTLCTAGANVKWCSHCSKQSGRSS